MEKILLGGYMGSGKSTVGKLLAKLLNLPFIDLDAYIEEQEARTITDIFREKGEIAFRRLEHQVLKSLVGSNESFVLALGGGTPCYAGNHLLLRSPGVESFYLKSGIEVLTSRLLLEKSQRPVISRVADGDLASFIGTHLFERDPFYRHAHHVIDTDGKSASEIAEIIYNQLNRA